MNVEIVLFFTISFPIEISSLAASLRSLRQLAHTGLTITNAMEERDLILRALVGYSVVEPEIVVLSAFVARRLGLERR